MSNYKKRIEAIFEDPKYIGEYRAKIDAIEALLHQVEAETKFNLLDMLITSKVHLSPVKMMELKAEFEAALHREES